MGYEFPDLEVDDWDSNWLVVAGEVVTPARKWSFSDPCLLTMEVHDLANWLFALGSGTPPQSRLFFTEPNLSFETVSSDSETANLGVYFACESLPTGVNSDDGEFFELFVLNRRDIGKAAITLCRSLEQFPLRAGARLFHSPCWEVRDNLPIGS
jgi:hypothetical protein